MAVKKGNPTREERLAAALRENLKRRKARARTLATAGEVKPTLNAGQAEGTEKPVSGHSSATKRG